MRLNKLLDQASKLRGGLTGSSSADIDQQAFLLISTAVSEYATHTDITSDPGVRSACDLARRVILAEAERQDSATIERTPAEAGIRALLLHEAVVYPYTLPDAVVSDTGETQKLYNEISRLSGWPQYRVAEAIREFDFDQP